MGRLYYVWINDKRDEINLPRIIPPDEAYIDYVLSLLGFLSHITS